MMNTILEAWKNLKYYIEKDTNINVDKFDKLITAQEGESDNKLPYKNTVRCYWCELEAKNNGWDVEKTVLTNAMCVAKGKTFGGKYACLMHSEYLLVAGWYGELLPTSPKEGECVHIGRYFPDSSKEGK